MGWTSGLVLCQKSKDSLCFYSIVRYCKMILTRDCLLEEWAHLQLLDDGPRIFFNDTHEYFLYMLCVPYVPEDTS